MEITVEKLALLVSEAYDRGMHGCAELKQQDMEDLFAKHGVKSSDDFRVWKVEDLKKLPEGTIFHHLIRGRCVVVGRANGTTYMLFDKGQPLDFHSDQDPWDKPMKLVYSER